MPISVPTARSYTLNPLPPSADEGRHFSPSALFTPPVPRRGKSTYRWLVLAPLILLGLFAILGLTVRPVRSVLLSLPLVGGLFDQPIWSIVGSVLPGDPPAVQAEKQSDALLKEDSDLTKVSKRLVEAELKEGAVKEREEQVQAREAAVAAQEKRLKQELTLAEGRRFVGEGRVAILRSMKANALLILVSAMTDEEIIEILRFMEPDEVGRILAGLDRYRAARLLATLSAGPDPTGRVD